MNKTAPNLRAALHEGVETALTRAGDPFSRHEAVHAAIDAALAATEAPAPESLRAAVQAVVTEMVEVARESGEQEGGNEQRWRKRLYIALSEAAVAVPLDADAYEDAMAAKWREGYDEGTADATEAPAPHRGADGVGLHCAGCADEAAVAVPLDVERLRCCDDPTPSVHNGQPYCEACDTTLVPASPQQAAAWLASPFQPDYRDAKP